MKDKLNIKIGRVNNFIIKLVEIDLTCCLTILNEDFFNQLSRIPTISRAKTIMILEGTQRAEVISFSDRIAFKTEQACREAGKISIEGKNYEICDGDVIHFRFNV